MKEQTWVSALLRYLWTNLIIVLVIAVFAGVTFFFVGGFSVRAYSDRLFWGGIGAILLGLLSIFAATGATRMYGLPSVFTAQADARNVQDRMEDLRRVVAERYGFAFRMCIVGGVCIAISAIIEILTR